MNILDYETVDLNEEKKALVIIDQTLLPNETKIIELTEAQEIWDAIYLLQVRGAPAIGVAAGFGMYILADKIDDDKSFDEFYMEFVEKKDFLNSSRPTAVNLSWALNRMDNLVKLNSDKSIAEIKELLKKESIKIKEEDIAMCKSIGEYGLSLVKPGDGLLTHCNAGQLATSKYGTATAPMYLGHERGYNFKIFCDETRPLLQGARLTSYELSSAGLDVTLQCDNMVSSLMKEGKINAVFVGCDRVAANGDAANKIGTSGVAIIAKHYGVPFYVCAPSSTIDMNIKTGDDIVIEQRKPEEVTSMWYEKPMAPEGVKVYNPAFDVTDNSLITAIVTEKGIVRAPFDEGFKELFSK
ncbi:MAG: S-methyl-5-thioribose-1-phosphate isomerase [Lachnospiraceae bacterium]|nr:S-methyl-5-thioribose-1-phosphate isomerase [Lachnospiraceae bacterium]